jgi:hypothetical protein
MLTFAIKVLSALALMGQVQMQKMTLGYSDSECALLYDAGEFQRTSHNCFNACTQVLRVSQDVEDIIKRNKVKEGYNYILCGNLCNRSGSRQYDERVRAKIERLDFNLDVCDIGLIDDQEFCEHQIGLNTFCMSKKNRNAEYKPQKKKYSSFTKQAFKHNVAQRQQCHTRYFRETTK